MDVLYPTSGTHAHIGLNVVLKLLDTNWVHLATTQLIEKIGRLDLQRHRLNSSSWVDGLVRTLNVYTVGENGMAGDAAWLPIELLDRLIEDLQTLSPGCVDAQKFEFTMAQRGQEDTYGSFWVGTPEQVAIASSRIARLGVVSNVLPQLSDEDLLTLITNIQEARLTRATSGV